MIQCASEGYASFSLKKLRPAIIKNDCDKA